jgi:sulfite exporter TauE/SafE
MVVTYAVKGEEGGPWHRKLIPNLAYQGAKITSYVAVGLGLGAIGSAFNLDGVRPYIMLLAGVFMVIMGLGMSGKFPWAARLTPRPPKFLVTQLSKARRKANSDAEIGESSIATPVTFGLLTGLMPCAPLMAAELAAAGTGNILYGGIAMLAFGLGTAPLMLAFGTASSLLPKDLKTKMMSVLAIVVILFGVMYLNRAAMRLGSPITLDTAKQAILGTPSGGASAASFKTGADGVVVIPLTIQNSKFIPSTLQIPAGKPVRIVVTRKEDTACSSQLSIPQLGKTVNLTPNGVTSVNLPAADAGQYTLTCGMGMMSGSLVAGGGGAPSGGESPLPWAILTLASAGGALWLGRGMQRSPKPAPTRRAPATSAIAGLNPKHVGLAVVLIGVASLLGLVLGGAGPR